MIYGLFCVNLSSHLSGAMDIYEKGYLWFLMMLLGCGLGYLLPYMILAIGNVKEMNRQQEHMAYLWILYGCIILFRFIRGIFERNVYPDLSFFSEWKISPVGLFDVFFQGIFLGSLLEGAETDFQGMYAFDVTWWVALGSGFVRMVICVFHEPVYQPMSILHREIPFGISGEVLEYRFLICICFILLQMTIGRLFYGKADCYGFCACGLQWFCNYGKGEQLLYLMTFSYLLLFLFAICKKNITKTCRLKSPMPFLPCIAAAYLLV